MVRMMDSAIDKIREAARGTEYENELYLVGGVVRDKLMGRPVGEDVDIVLEGDALELANFLYRAGVAEHRPVTYPRFGTAMVLVEGHNIELVSSRRESYAPTTRKPEVEAATLYDDVMRRDFTINTLLENLHTGEVLDLTGKGVADIRSGIIRTPTEPASTFYDDPLRMLRAIRFAVRFGFEIEPRTYEAIVQDASRLHIISRERIRDEFVKMLLSPQPARGMRMLKETGLLRQFAPEFLDMQGVTQTGGHIYNVWEHTLHALETLPDDADLTLRLAVLFHDIGKPATRSVDEECDTHFLGHDELGVRIAGRVLRQLRFPTGEIARVSRLVSMHMRVGEYTSDWSDSAVRRLIRDAGGDISDLLVLSMADRRGANPQASTRDLQELRQRVQELLLKTQVRDLCSPLNGREIMELLDIPPGPKVKEVKDFLCDAVIEGDIPPRDKEAARDTVLRRFRTDPN